MRERDLRRPRGDLDGHWGGWTILGLVDTTAPRPAQATQGR